MFFQDIADTLKESRWQQLIASGQVVAVDGDDGQQRFGRVSLQDDKIYLHTLQDDEDLGKCFQLNVSDMLANI